jgi:rhamnogalacturonyl hydrolase YesR
MQRANAWFMNQHPDPGAPAPGDRPSNLWTRAVYYEGLMALYQLDPEPAFKQYAVDWGSANNWGLRNGVMSDNADAQCAGQTYIDLYQLDGSSNPERIADIQASLDLMVSAADTGAWTWIDAIQMSMPTFARLGALTGDSAYYDQMWGLYSHTRNTEGGGLFDEATGLWWRDADYAPGGTYTQSPNGIDIYWSRGNGWVIAALARVLDKLPAGDAHRSQYEQDLQAMASALVPLQRDDGFWNTSLLDPMHCAAKGLPDEDGPETSGTALFAFGIGWGIRNGLLSESDYGAPLLRAWDALSQTALHDDGFLGYVQSTGAEPCDPDGERGLGADITPNFDDYGVGCFLLAGSELAKLGG